MTEDVIAKWLALPGRYTNQFVRFCLVGSVGTAVHYSALGTIVYFQWNPMIGSGVGS